MATERTPGRLRRRETQDDHRCMAQRNVLDLLFAAALIGLVACTPRGDGGVIATASPTTTTTAAPETATATSTSAPSTTADPWAYCRQVGTIDAPDARYSGEPVPPAIAEGIRRATGASDSAPLDVFVRGTSWRCMDGKVLACTVGANLPCGEKANTSRTPSAAMTEFCAANAEAAVIPAFVTGRATVYEWRCSAGAPSVVRQVVEADAQGFLASFWHELPPS